MIIERNDVLTQFALLSGLSTTEAALWGDFCEICAEEICANLRPSVDGGKHRKRLSMAAAVLAKERFDMLQTDAETMRVGDFSFAKGKNKISENLAWEMIGELLNKNRPILLGVNADVC